MSQKKVSPVVQFLVIRGGDYSINPALISEVDWSKRDCVTIAMITGNEFDIDDDQEIADLKAAIGVE